MADDIVLGKPVHTPSQKDFRYLRERVAAPEHRGSLELLAYWQHCKTQGGMQMGRDVPSKTLAKLLPNIAVTEPLEDWLDGRIRLAGFVYLERFGRDITGLSIRELYSKDPSGADALLAAARYCAGHGCPTVLRTSVMAGDIAVMRFEILALPLFAPDKSAVWNLAGTFRY